MARKITRTKVIILIVAILLLGGVAAYFVTSTGIFSPQQKAADTHLDTGTAYKDGFQKSKTKIGELIASGNKQSIKEADDLIETEISAANDSGNTTYIVDAHLAKAALLTETGRAQEALDSVLSSLDEKYALDSDFKNDIYVQLSLAYTELGDTAKAEGYLSQIQGRGGD